MKFPGWLPKSISDEAEYYLSTPHDPEIKTIVERLTTRIDMKDVWKKLSKCKHQPKGRNNILHEVLSSLSYWDFIKDNDYLLRPSERKARKLEVIKTIESLESLLKKYHLLIMDYEPECLNPVDIELNRIKKNLRNFDLFWEDLPVKVNAENAKRTFIIKRLKHFMSSEYGKPLYGEIATIACMVFDVTDIEADHVKKI